MPPLPVRLMLTFPAKDYHHPLASTKLHCWVTEVNNLPSHYVKLKLLGIKPVTSGTCLQNGCI